MLPAATDISYVYCRLYLWYEYERLVGLKNVLSLDAFFEELHNMAPAYNHFWIWTSYGLQLF
jgi:hypothetical protein